MGVVAESAPQYVGLVTRTIAFALDGALINIVAIANGRRRRAGPLGAADPRTTSTPSRCGSPASGRVVDQNVTKYPTPHSA